ncbi:putative peptidase YuxL [Caldalkalibacillus thermarum]|uniref:S9 family peptidase n=1 Tax=Caldalkalibacillus thermarum TaxID=296745 RepID=UPI00166EBEB2|nr:S9 family peptidase [Caldalkalibacillus thermarum]GGK23573.1 putative peptidase YuxL [Caldalkalibacillus thermarum]
MRKRPLEAEDLFKLKLVGDPQVSPGGDKVAYVLTQMDLEKDGYTSSVYVSDWRDAGKQWTHYHSGERLVQDKHPRWSPDGKLLAFLSNRTGKEQVWIMPVSGGEAQPLTNVPQGVRQFVWSPDGKKMALSIRGDINTDQEETTKSDVKQVARLRYKADGTGLFDDKRLHIYIFDLQTRHYERITDERFDFMEPVFSPDGMKLAYIGSKAEDQEWNYLPAIWLYDLKTGEEQCLYQGQGRIQGLSYSPDGRWIAFVGHDKGEISSANLNVWVVSTQTGEARNVSEHLDYTAEDVIGVDAKYDTGRLRPLWDSTSTNLYFVATVRGDVRLFKTNLSGEVSGPHSPAGHTITSFDLIDDDHAVFIQAHPHSPGDVVVQSLDKIEDQKQLTDWNGALLRDEIALSTPEKIEYTSVDGWKIEGWILKPYGFDPNKKYPLILQIHGGPHTAYGNGFHHEMQWMAARGYVVLYTNPRGSHGYGQRFVEACVGDWAGKDYEDIMAGVDYVLKCYDFVDEAQLFVTGGSYGGYMTNMIVTKTNRFKAAVTQRCLSNLYSFYGTSDIGFYFGKWQLGGADLWEDEDKIMAFSPIRYARNVKTPVLIMHSEQDLRCPMEQAEQWYVALRRLGVKTKLIRFPDENHDLSRSGKPKHRLERLHHILNWFEEHRERGKSN